MNSKVTAYYNDGSGTVDRIVMEAIDFEDARRIEPSKWSLEPPPIGVVVTAPILQSGTRIGTCVVRDAEGNTFRPGPRRIATPAPTIVPDVLAAQLAEHARVKAVEAAQVKSDGVVVPLAPTKH